MKQLGTIFKFELSGYLKNKVFVGITVFLVVAIAIVMFIPNIAALFASDGDDVVEPTDEFPKMLVYADSAELSELVVSYFKEAFPTYCVIADVMDADNSSGDAIDAVKSRIINGEAECAFVMNSASSYTYYTDVLSIYDTNTEVADSVLQEVCRISAMADSGLTAEQISSILSIGVEGSIVTLGKDQMQNFLYTYIMIFALYMVILLYGQMVATNVASEKSSKAIEVLITSAKPASMMFGKVLASCTAGLLQLVAVFGSAVLFYNINSSAWGDIAIIQSLFNIPIGLFVYLIVFFVLGFLIYAFLYGAIGSTATKLEDINTSVLPITFLFIFAFIVVMSALGSGNVDTVLMKICSYVPFTSPMAMFTRICMSTVAWYEIFISIALLVAATVGTGILSARIYRAGVLMYGVPPRFGTIIKTVFNRR